MRLTILLRSIRATNQPQGEDPQPASNTSHDGTNSPLTSQGQAVRSRRVCANRRSSRAMLGVQTSNESTEPPVTSQGQQLRSRRVFTDGRRTHAMAAMQPPNESTEAPSTEAPIISQGQQLASRRARPDLRRAHRMRRIQPSNNVANIPTLQGSTMHLPSPTFCQHCCAKKFAFESDHFCCDNGRIKVQSDEWPAELKRLYTSFEDDALHFQKYARLYNNLFAFSSIAGGINAETKKGIHVFRLQGQLYHFVPDLIPTDGRPKYLQLYFFDPAHEKENRLGLFPNLRDDVMQKLMKIMEDNPYTRFFKSLKDLNILEDTQILINKTVRSDQHTHNPPTSDEVALILPDNCSSDFNTSPYISVFGKSNDTHRIMHYYGCYDPLQYPLILPKGNNGWHQGIPKQLDPFIQRQPFVPPKNINDPSLSITDLLDQEEAVAESGRGKKRTMVSCREYYACRLQIRAENCLLRTGRLLQQFFVDMYVKMENTRLDFFRQNQKLIRAELYEGIMDCLANGERDANNIGHRVVLPPTFIGGPRDMKKRYLNAMALVRKYGKPDIFLTMTCNPKWKEIQDELSPGEKVENRPDLVARIFRAKLMVLKKKIMEDEFFGPVAGMIYVVEFQKRGLPHVHFLLILKRGFKIKAPEQFDNFVCAEIPGIDRPYLRSLVLKHMMHGPCGPMFPDCPCMQKKGNALKCRSNYPKKHVEFTTSSSDGYPLYRRRCNGDSVIVRKFTMDNQWVIPYNPQLLELFDCHMNVEVCSTITAVKYLYKYVYKGHDKVSFSLLSSDKPVDEIKAFQAGRWVSPPEAAWRMFGFDLCDMSPSVLPLQVHLPNKQSVSFSPNEDVRSIVRNSNKYETQLTAFFRMNDAEAKRPKNADEAERPKILYSECPEHFVWSKKTKMWTPRIGKKQVGRLVFVNPGEGERYFLRLLLTHVEGPTSFEDLLTVDGIRCQSFKEAAVKRRLVEADDAIDQCLKEAVEFQMPAALRQLFATTLLFSHPAEPRTLWNKYYPALSEDYKHSYPLDEKKVRHLTCQDIERLLKPGGKSFLDFELADLHKIADESHLVSCSREVIDAINAPVPQNFVGLWKKLNSKQREAYKAIMACVKQNKAGVFFIDGPGGTGKTFLYCALYAKVRLMNKIVLPAASSGIAASNIPSGRTAHSRFKIPLDSDESMVCSVPKQSDLAQLLREAALIIWDEASMARKENVEALDRLLRDVCTSARPFGGKVIVFGGDFRQVLPVIPKRTQHELVDYSLVSSYLWPTFQRFTLAENMRAREDPEFTAFLLSLGNGEFQKSEQANIQLPCSLVSRLPAGDNALQHLVKAVYPDLEQLAANPHAFTARATLTPTNDEVDCINKLVIDSFPGQANTYTSYDRTVDDDCNAHPVEFLNTLCPGGMSPHKLTLKLNCPVILLRNLNPSAGLCNGTRLICRGFKPNLIICEIATGYRAGEYVFIPRINLRPSNSITYPYRFERRQFPIKLCFAMTINKSQGQTLSEVAVYLRKQCFSHGQLYVALSRARKASSVKVFIDGGNEPSEPTSYATNVVSFELLKKAGIL